MNVTLELEMTEECSFEYKKLEQIQININLDNPDYQVTKQGKEDSVDFNSDNNQLVWAVSNLHERVSTVLTFNAPNLQLEDLFPLQVHFKEDYSVLDLKVGLVEGAVNGEPLSHKIAYLLQTD